MKNLSLVFIFFLLFSFNVNALINGKKLSTQMPIVSIHFKNNSHICSGVFLNENRILTAGHCLRDQGIYKRFNLEIEKILNSKQEKLEFKVLELVPHTNFRYNFFGNMSDLGIIKLQKQKREFNFPLIYTGSKLSGRGLYFACGKTQVKRKNLKCLEGENEYTLLFDQIVSFGYSIPAKEDGSNVSVAPNDSGGIIIDSVSNEIVGILWGTWTPWLYEYSIQAPSFATPLSSKENLDFIMQNL